MRPFPIAFVVILGVISSVLEFRDVKQWTVFFMADLVEAIPLILLALLTFIYLFKPTPGQGVKTFISSIIGICFLCLIFGHMYFRSQLDASKTAFKAYNYDISDEGFILDFKENKHLKGQLIEKFSEKFYWGKYERLGDTLIVELDADFNLNKKAVIKNDTIRFLNGATYFLVEKE